MNHRSPRMLDAAETARALPYRQLVDALRAMLLRLHAGRTTSPDRLVLPLPGGALLAMPASDGEFASTKLVTVHVGNPARGLPTLLGEVVLMRADTGERLLILDGPTLTGRRTAALSALAARTLAPGVDGPMLVIGAGVQGRVHLEAFAEVIGVRQAWVASRNAASAQVLAAYGRAIGLDARAVGDPLTVLGQARIVVTATASLAPLIPDQVRDDALVCAVGAYRPEMCELPATLVRRARVFVDDLAGARHEAGDILQAGLDWALVTPLEAVIAGTAATSQARPGAAPIVFKSVGHALWDLAAARLAYESGDAR